MLEGMPLEKVVSGSTAGPGAAASGGSVGSVGSRDGSVGSRDGSAASGSALCAASRGGSRGGSVSITLRFFGLALSSPPFHSQSGS